MVVCNLALRNYSTLECIVAAIDQWPRGMDILVAGNFNTDMESLDGHKGNELIAVVMAIEVL